MFNHSIRVPRLYKFAARILKDLKESGNSLKQLLYKTKHPNLKAIYALVTETLNKNEHIELLLKKSQILIKEDRLDPFLTKILITELLWGKQQLMGQSKPVTTVLAYHQTFKAHLSDLTNDAKCRSEYKVTKPRYVRVNTIFLTTNEAVDIYWDEGWALVRCLNKNDYDSFLKMVSTLEPNHFMIDLHINDLLIFPPRTEFHHSEAYKHGRILLQDKASCLPVKILNPPPNSTVLDMCAAPGMKTTQIAAMLNNQGIVYAVEQNESRFKILNGMVENAGATCVKTILNDVLNLTGEDCPNVEYIIVDPTCSGSGITDRFELDEMKNVHDEWRLEKLKRFQIKILKHAMYKFPDAKRIVYSTCSLYRKENEEVINEIMKSCTNFKLVPVRNLLDAPWHNFGSLDYGIIGEYCLCAKPDQDLTNGFFIAVFERETKDVYEAGKQNDDIFNKNENKSFSKCKSDENFKAKIGQVSKNNKKNLKKRNFVEKNQFSNNVNESEQKECKNQEITNKHSAVNSSEEVVETESISEKKKIKESDCVLEVQTPNRNQKRKNKKKSKKRKIGLVSECKPDVKYLNNSLEKGNNNIVDDIKESSNKLNEFKNKKVASEKKSKTKMHTSKINTQNNKHNLKKKKTKESDLAAITLNTNKRKRTKSYDESLMNDLKTSNSSKNATKLEEHKKNKNIKKRNSTDIEESCQIFNEMFKC